MKTFLYSGVSINNYFITLRNVNDSYTLYFFLSLYQFFSSRDLVYLYLLLTKLEHDTIIFIIQFQLK